MLNLAIYASVMAWVDPWDCDFHEHQMCAPGDSWAALGGDELAVSLWYGEHVLYIHGRTGTHIYVSN